jgi:hypothetical protein
MNKDERKRLEKLRDDANKGIDRAWEKLTLPDLLLLLREDKGLRALIRNIVASPEASDVIEDGDVSGRTYHEEPDERRACSPPPPTTQFAPPLTDALRNQIAPELALLQAVRADAEFAAEWLGDQSENEGRQLLRLIACASQWDLLSDLWEKLANRCKQAQRAVSSGELHILRAAVALHNLRWQGRQAHLAEVAAGTTYDYERHQRGTATGDHVRALWLPGLVNAGGALHKKPLVQT